MKNIYVIIFFIFFSCKVKKEEDYKNLIIEIDGIFENYILNYLDKSKIIEYNKDSINCNQANDFLFKVGVDDQKVRTSGSEDISLIDSINQVKLISLLEKCNVPFKSLNKQSIEAVFLTLQHSGDANFMAYYYNVIKNNRYNDEILALYVDRFLLINNKKQIFGSQFIVKDGNLELEKVEDLEHINYRRKLFKMKTIEEYIIFANKQKD